MEHIAFSLLICILLMGVVVDKFKGVQNLFIESVQGSDFWRFKYVGSSLYGSHSSP